MALNEVFKHADIISLHCPLNQHTKHIIDKKTIASMKKGVMIINTSRGALIDTADVIEGLINKKKTCFLKIFQRVSFKMNSF